MPSTAFNFDWGFTDAQIEVTPEWYAPAWPLMAATQPAFWRLVIDWQVTAVTMNSGPFQGGCKSPITATITGSGHVGDPHSNGQLDARANGTGTGVVVGAAPSAQGRNWAWIDGVLNDMRLKTNGTMDIVMVIGQAAPNGWTNADYKKFCAECVVRYGPGGQGIRTDGPWAAINSGWGVRYWEIWNEQNNSVYWGQTVNPIQYTSFLQAGYQGIKSVAPSTPAPGTRPTGNQSVVIFGGMQHIPFSGVQFGYGYFGFDEVSFLQKCYAAAIAMGTTLGTMFDSMATHVYPSGDFAYSSGPGQQFPSNLISSMNFPAVNTGAQPKITAMASGSGAVNITPAQSGRLTTTAIASGFGTINNYEPSGDYNSVNGGIPTMAMDNMRQVVGVYALMVANGDGAKKIKITECGFGVYRAGWTPDLQNRATQALFALFNALPYIDMVLLYNAIDANNSRTDDGYTGFGALAYDRTPRPLYNWLLTLPVLSGGAVPQVITATATGSGSITSVGSSTITATATGTGVSLGSGGIITLTAHGSGSVTPTGRAAPTITSTAHGAGVVGKVGSAGNLTGGAGSSLFHATTVGVGKIDINKHQNGDANVLALAIGAGTVVPFKPAVFTAIAVGGGTVDRSGIGLEIGVVGVVGQAAASVTAAESTISGLLSGGAGQRPVTGTATGTGSVGNAQGGVSTISFTALTAGLLKTVGATAQVVTASAQGSGFVGVVGAAAPVFTATGLGFGPGAFTDQGSLSITDTATGAGKVGAVGAAAPTFSATATNASTVQELDSATATITATATGTGVMGKVTGAVGTINATATGAGVRAMFTGAAITETATASGAGLIAGLNGGTQTVTATATGAGLIGESTSGIDAITATATGTGVVKLVTGGTSSLTATATGSGTVGKVGAGSTTVTATALGLSPHFVSRDSSTGNLMYNGQRFRFGGANLFQDIGVVSSANGNNYGGTVVGSTYLATHTQIDAALASAINGTGATVIRPYAGAVGQVGEANATQPTLGVFNAASLENIDYLLQRCNALGVKVILTFTDDYTSKQWYVAQTGGGTDDNFWTRTAVLTAVKAHISFVLNHVNQYTNVAYKNDPAILAWETINEGSGAGASAAAVSAWTDAVSQHIKVTESAQQLVLDGVYGTTGDWVTYDTTRLSLTYVDIYSNHAYDQYRTPGNMVLEAQNAHTFGKAFIIGEFSWDDKYVNGSTLPWYLPWLLAYIESTTAVDGDLYFQMLAPSTHWNDHFTIHYPAYLDTNGNSVVEMQTRTTQLSDHAARMSGLVTPKVFVSEDFTDTNGTALDVHVGAIGATWNMQDGWTGVANIQSNRLYGNATQARYFASGIPAGSNYQVTANIYVASNTASCYAGVLIHGFTEVNQGYVAYFWNQGGSYTVSLDYEGSGTNLATVSGLATPTVGSTYPLTVTIQTTPASTTSIINVYWNGALVLGLITETNLPHAGRTGILLLNGSTTTGYHIDSLVASDPVGGNPVVTATTVGAGVVSRTTGGTSSITATATGSGVVGKVTGAAVTATATATGAGLIGGALFLIDTFTDTNGTNLTAHTPNTGGAWSVQSGNGGGCAIDTNRAYGTSSTQMINAATSLSADYEVIGQMIPLSLINNTSWGVMGRASNSADTCYFAFLYAFSGSFSLFLAKFVNGAYTQLATVGLPTQPTLGTTHELKLRMIGSSLSVYYDGALLISPVTDTDITATGFAGLVLGTATTTTGVAIDQITAGPINYPDTATDSISATATGTGALGFTGGATSTDTATATGAGAVGELTGATVTITATATGSGTAAAAGTGGGTQTITATATGSGTVKGASRQHVYRVITRHRLR